MNTFIDKFENIYYQKLIGKWDRAAGWKIVFDCLISQNKNYYHIIETGILRNWENWRDGQSTFLLQEFVKQYEGKVDAVDISSEACKISENFLDNKYVNVHCDDSLNFLTKIDLSNVSLFHLDSYDVIWEDPQPSAHHHLKEFLIIEKFLLPGSIVVIDDNRIIKGNRTGKGLEIFKYLESKNIKPIHDGYQIIYKF
jgi:hypothetical protein